MRKKFPPLFILMLILPTLAGAVEFSLKISGGINFVKMDNVNRVHKDWLEWIKRDAEVHATFNFLGGSVPDFGSIVNFEGELLLSINKNFAFSFGSGLLYGEIPQNQTETSIERVVGTFIHVHPLQISAIPMTISGYYFLNLTDRLQLFGRAGGGVILVKFVNRDGRRLTQNKAWTYQKFNITNAQSPMFLGAFGGVFEVEPGIRVFFESSYRRAQITGFSGTNGTVGQPGQTGNLYLYEEYDTERDIWTAQFNVWAEQPEGANFRNVQEAVIDLSGLSFKLGIIIRF
ncbi:hypothetical protein ACFLT9_07755 [Acidobacteriota bacterium]